MSSEIDAFRSEIATRTFDFCDRCEISDVLRVSLAGACLLIFCNHSPLVDLSDRANIGHATDGSSATQIIFIVLALAMATVLLRLNFGKLRPLLSLPVMTLAAWLTLTLATSVEPALSIRRMIFFAIVTIIAAGILLLMRNVRQFALTLAIMALLVLISSYLAVAFLPHLAIHSARFDAINEPEHDGLWRGIFSHKNEAGGVMALLFLTGLFVAAALSRFWGTTIVLLSGLFLAMANSKSVIALLPLIILAPSLCAWVRSVPLRIAILAGPIALINLFSLGSVFIPPIGGALAGILTDTSFTGRTEIWQFAADRIMERPLFGWGFGAFWGTERAAFVTSSAAEWVSKTTQAHNTYIDVALTLGFPGLLLTIVAFVFAPLHDLQKIAPDGPIEPVVMYFLRLWLLALASGSFETVLFASNAAIFCMFILAVFGLRMSTTYSIVIS